MSPIMNDATKIRVRAVEKISSKPLVLFSDISFVTP